MTARMNRLALHLCRPPKFDAILAKSIFPIFGLALPKKLFLNIRMKNVADHIALTQIRGL